MYPLATQIQHLPIVSLQTGETVAWTRQALLSIARLELMAFYCDVPEQSGPLLLLSSDIRQMASDCFIVDGEESLTDPQDLVRFDALLRESLDPLGAGVVTDTGRKLGSVKDFTFNPETSCLQQLSVKPPFPRSLFEATLLIDRTQIIDITPRRFTIRDTTVKTTPLLPQVTKTQA
jgi:hypothetical protein